MRERALLLNRHQTEELRLWARATHKLVVLTRPPDDRHRGIEQLELDPVEPREQDQKLGRECAPMKHWMSELEAEKYACKMRWATPSWRSLLVFLITSVTLVVSPVVSYAQNPSYSLSVSQLTPASINEFTAALPTSTVTITPANGYKGTVTVSCTVRAAPAGPSGPFCALRPQQLTVSSPTSTLTVTTTSQTGVGTYPISVTAVDQSGLAPSNGEQFSYLFVTPLTPSYTLTTSALTPVPVNPGGVASSTVAITPVNGYKGTVTVFCTVTTPPGASGPFCTFTTPATSPFSTQLTVTSPTSTLTVSTTSQTGIGTYPISVSGVDANNLPPSNGAQSLALVVTPPLTRSYSLTVSPLTPASINQFTAASATSTVTIAPVNGYIGSVNLNCTVMGRPPGSTGPDCTLAPSTVAGGSGVSTLTVKTTSQTGCGTYPIWVTGVDGSGLASSNGTQHLSLNVVTSANEVCPLYGFVDLHTHPLSNLGFGGKLVYGGADIGSLLPADPDCNHNVRATSEQQALGHDKSTHGGVNFLNPLDNPCGDFLREIVIHSVQTGLKGANQDGDAKGYPDFDKWPVWNDLTHQKMWIEWIRRAHQGGLRVMVALAHNNKTLGDMVAGPGDYPTDDKWSADKQIGEIRDFVMRHVDFMEVARSSADVHRIVSANKLAVIIGIEVDHIGNFPAAGVPVLGPPPPPPRDADVIAEIDRLYGEDVRYIFPIHLLDNAFGGSAAYMNLFNVSNLREDGHSYALVCASADDNIGYSYNNDDLDFTNILGQLAKTGVAVASISYPPCQWGQKNSLGLTPSGVVAIKQMMRRGMLIDIDHMSQAAADQMLALATEFNYPVNSGHNGLRGALGCGSQNERALRADQYAKIGSLHGMAGVGSGGLTSQQWLKLYSQVIQSMGGGSIVAGFGTDTNGLTLGMPPRPGAAGRPASQVPGPQYQLYVQCALSCKITPLITSCVNDCATQFPHAYITEPGSLDAVQYNQAFPRSTDGNHVWDYNRDGVAHYGMLWDFLQDVRTLQGGSTMVDNNFMYGADYFFHTWQIAEAKAANVK
jgi:hypothetical protein